MERTEDFLARVGELGLEGAVAKRLSSTYLPGRRCTASVKHKLRREERLVVAGVRRTSGGIAEAISVARRLSGGSLRGAGSIELGLGAEPLGHPEHRLADLPQRRRGHVCWYPAEVTVVASVHGLSDGPVRDGILRHVVGS
jgi:ATP-dependent DNA ligase